MGTPTPTLARTPLHEMSDEQLRFYVEDELAPAWKRGIAEMLLGERTLETEQVSDLALRISAYHA